MYKIHRQLDRPLHPKLHDHTPIQIPHKLLFGPTPRDSGREIVVSKSIAEMSYDPQRQVLQVEHFSGQVYEADDFGSTNYEELAASNDFVAVFRQIDKSRLRFVGRDLPVFR